MVHKEEIESSGGISDLSDEEINREDEVSPALATIPGNEGLDSAKSSMSNILSGFQMITSRAETLEEWNEQIAAMLDADRAQAGSDMSGFEATTTIDIDETQGSRLPKATRPNRMKQKERKQQASDSPYDRLVRTEVNSVQPDPTLRDFLESHGDHPHTSSTTPIETKVILTQPIIVIPQSGKVKNESLKTPSTKKGRTPKTPSTKNGRKNTLLSKDRVTSGRVTRSMTRASMSSRRK